jgi:pimeloyl-ACP methyl ester carboxylesterase
VGRFARWLCEPLLRSFEHDGRMSRAISRWVFERAFEDRTRMEAAWADQRTQVPVEYPRMLRESFDRPVGFELRDFASEIAAPTFLLEGSRAGTQPRFPELGVTLRERLGDRFQYEAIAGGHYLQLDRPEQVNRRLAGFVETLAPTEPVSG